MFSEKSVLAHIRVPQKVQQRRRMQSDRPLIAILTVNGSLLRLVEPRLHFESWILVFRDHLGQLAPLFKTIVPTICPSTTSKHVSFDLSVHPVSVSPSNKTCQPSAKTGEEIKTIRIINLQTTGLIRFFIEHLIGSFMRPCTLNS